MPIGRRLENLELYFVVLHELLDAILELILSALLVHEPALLDLLRRFSHLSLLRQPRLLGQLLLFVIINRLVRLQIVVVIELDLLCLLQAQPIVRLVQLLFFRHVEYIGILLRRFRGSILTRLHLQITLRLRFHFSLGPDGRDDRHRCSALWLGAFFAVRRRRHLRFVFVPVADWCLRSTDSAQQRIVIHSLRHFRLLGHNRRLLHSG